jgi:hypothetical protein
MVGDERKLENGKWSLRARQLGHLSQGRRGEGFMD